MFQNNNKKYNTRKIHRLICIAFHGDNKRLEVNHIDGNKSNNKPCNLEWCTRSENVKHAFKIGLAKPLRGELNGCAKLTNEIVLEIRKAKDEGGRYWGRNEIAKKYNMTLKRCKK